MGGDTESWVGEVSSKLKAGRTATEVELNVSRFKMVRANGTWGFALTLGTAGMRASPRPVLFEQIHALNAFSFEP